MTAIHACSPAKLNLFLHVTGQRDDGYHTLQTVFQLLNWGDDMVFELRDTPGITLSGDTNDLAPQENLILRAANALTNPRAQGVHIDITKRIPRGGGLGGGSSNAATTLLALNRLWRLELSPRQLATTATTLGADVPIFVYGHNAWAEGIGEAFSPINLPKRWFVIAQPACEVSTTEIFAHPELTRNTAPITVQSFFSGAGHNDLQAVVLAQFPEVQQAWEWLYSHSPTVKMTGSGACFFVALATEEEAERIAQDAPAGLRVVVAEGLDRLPEMREAV
ncbi:MAG: 4-(cytidine 5'-diphospho)-2-C-methyl-D-erythritol kinase [Luminiphilus sp.]|jgi:4-diphosphocytidyl-2-C-methyl-D-erythritol kinase|nr:4-(cytidine 5'-diphospho)-2-C-methyl-D-erythritol kinase [Luminiphilus sp.]